jgi:hypothetical protein
MDEGKDRLFIHGGRAGLIRILSAESEIRQSLIRGNQTSISPAPRLAQA